MFLYFKIHLNMPSLKKTEVTKKSQKVYDEKNKHNVIYFCINTNYYDNQIYPTYVYSSNSRPLTV